MVWMSKYDEKFISLFNKANKKINTKYSFLFLQLNNNYDLLDFRIII